MKIQSLQILAENLIRSGFVFESRGVQSSVSGAYQIVEVGDTGPLSVSAISIAENSVNFYLEIVRQGKFSWLLFDASLVQIWYRRRGNAVVAHRYCYIPAPFDLDLRQEESESQLSRADRGT
jgi:hypothetical protein